RLSPEFCAAIDRLLVVADGERHPTLFQLKQYPPNPRPDDILVYLERFDLLHAIGPAKLDFTDAVRVMEIVTDESMAKEERAINPFTTVDDDELRDAFAVCREHCQLGEHGMIDELLARHQHLKRYLPRFLQLPFLA